MPSFKFVGVMLSCALTFSSVCFGEVITVDLNGGGDYTEIQPAIDAAVDSDTVLVKPGQYLATEPITFLGKAITVRGERGAKETTIRLSESLLGLRWNRAVVVFDQSESGRTVLEGFTLTGEGDSGSGVVCRGGSSPTLTNCTIAGNSALSGGGVYSSGSSPTFVNCTITGNAARADGGGVYL